MEGIRSYKESALNKRVMEKLTQTLVIHYSGLFIHVKLYRNLDEQIKSVQSRDANGKAERDNKKTSMSLETFSLDKSPVKFTQFCFINKISSILFILIMFLLYPGLGEMPCIIVKS